jgi:hypothetical protein
MDMSNEFVCSIEENLATSVSLAKYNNMKKSSKVNNLLCGALVSSTLFLSPNVDQFLYNPDILCMNNYLSSITFAGKDNVCSDESYIPHKKKATAKLKKQYTPTDDELSDLIKENEALDLLFIDNKEDYKEFIKYNSGRLLSTLERWL